MKYYCKNCGVDIKFGFRVTAIEVVCHICNYIMVKIPDYETPAQYKSRTGKSYSDNGLVWKQIEKITGRKRWIPEAYGNVFPSNTVVIASPLVPPPDDFVPEETK